MAVYAETTIGRNINLVTNLTENRQKHPNVSFCDFRGGSAAAVSADRMLKQAKNTPFCIFDDLLRSRPAFDWNANDAGASS